MNHEVVVLSRDSRSGGFHCQTTPVLAGQWRRPFEAGVKLLIMAPVLCLQDWGIVESCRQRSRQGHSILVETAGEFRCRLRGELACRLATVPSPLGNHPPCLHIHAEVTLA